MTSTATMTGSTFCLQCGSKFQLISGKELFCDKDCYEAHEDRQWDYSDGGNYRSSAKTESLTRQDGKVIVMRLCEEKIAGRWEPFFSIVRSIEVA